MAYVPVPKDLTKVKTKVAFNLTKRQLIFFAAALALGLPLFFLLKNSAGTSYIASLSMRKLIDERGNTYYGIDEDIRDRLRSKLMRAVLSFKV